MERNEIATAVKTVIEVSMESINGEIMERILIRQWTMELINSRCQLLSLNQRDNET